MQKELEIATAEMERAQHRLVTLEREKETLKQQVASLNPPHSDELDMTNRLATAGEM